MWIRIRAVIIDEPLAAEHLAILLDETCQVEVVGSAADSEAGVDLCAELRPDAVVLETSLPGRDRVSLARQLAMLPQAPRLVFTTGNPNRATDAFRLKAVDYLLKPLDPGQVDEAVNRLLAYLRPFESDSLPVSAPGVNLTLTQGKMYFTGAPDVLLNRYRRTSAPPSTSKCAIKALLWRASSMGFQGFAVTFFLLQKDLPRPPRPALRVRFASSDVASVETTIVTGRTKTREPYTYWY
jgi:CheY-like chemotaxis protein